MSKGLSSTPYSRVICQSWLEEKEVREVAREDNVNERVWAGVIGLVIVFVNVLDGSWDDES